MNSCVLAQKKKARGRGEVCNGGGGRRWRGRNKKVGIYGGGGGEEFAVVIKRPITHQKSKNSGLKGPTKKEGDELIPNINSIYLFKMEK